MYLLVHFSYIGAWILEVQDDESLRKWKEQLLGSVDLNNIGGACMSSYFLFPYLKLCEFVGFQLLKFFKYILVSVNSFISIINVTCSCREF
jgi:hypothetical protein